MALAENEKANEHQGKFVEIIVPTKLKVEKRLVEGDATGHIQSEYSLDSGQELAPLVRELLKHGARVFLTDNDRDIIVHSEESLNFSRDVEASWGVVI